MKNFTRRGIGLIVLMFLVITGFHFSHNLKETVEPPSQLWGRELDLGEITPYKKTPSITSEGNKSYILTANKTHFIKTTLDRSGLSEIKKEKLDIKGAEPGKVVKYKWAGDIILWTENFELYYSHRSAAGDYAEKKKLLDKVSDFQLIESGDKAYIAAATEDGVYVYCNSRGNISLLGQRYDFPKAKGVSFALDKSGVLHMAVYSHDNATEYPIQYLTFEDNTWVLKGEKVERLLFRSWKISEIDIGLDDTDVYIFYGITKWDAYGVSAKTHMGVKSLGDRTMDLNFDQMAIIQGEDPNQTYITEVRCIKEQSDTLRAAVIRDDYSRKVRGGFTVLELRFDGGRLVERTKMVNTRSWISNMAYQKDGDTRAVVFIDTAGKAIYNPYYSETSKEFQKYSNRGHGKDYVNAFLDVLPGYVNALLIMLIKTIVYLPALLWIFIVEFFELKKYRNNRKLAIAIPFSIYLFVKLVSINTFYTPVSLSLMPEVLRFFGAKYLYGASLSFIALYAAHLFRKGRKDMGYIVEFLIFMLLDLVFTCFLYTAFLV